MRPVAVSLNEENWDLLAEICSNFSEKVEIYFNRREIVFGNYSSERMQKSEVYYYLDCLKQPQQI